MVHVDQIVIGTGPVVSSIPTYGSMVSDMYIIILFIYLIITITNSRGT